MERPETAAGRVVYRGVLCCCNYPGTVAMKYYLDDFQLGAVSLEIEAKYSPASVHRDRDIQPEPEGFEIESVKCGGVDITKLVDLERVEQKLLEEGDDYDAYEPERE